MNRWRVLAPLVLLVVLAACTPQELSEIFAVEDLRSSSNRADAAAGHTAQAIDEDRAAQELTDQALKDKDRTKLEEAVRRRPYDARYRAYLGMLALMEGQLADYAGHLGSSRSAYVSQRSGNSDVTIERLQAEWTLVILGEFDHAMAIERERSPVDDARIWRLLWGYCANLFVYTDTYDSLPGDLESVVTLDEGRCEAYW